MQRLAFILATCLLTLSFAATADAGLGIGARYSYVRTEGLDDNSGMIGAFARLKRTLFGFEASIETRSDHYDGADFDVTPVTVSVMLTPLPVANLAAGVGYYRVETSYLTDPDQQTDHSIGFHYGAGVEWPLLPLLKLTGDLRYRMVDYELDNGLGETLTIDADGYAISAGLILYLK